MDILGRITRPGLAPLKINPWRHVRHPPPKLVHGTTIKPTDDDNETRWSAGDADALIGKVLTWAWDCSALRPSEAGWEVWVDVW